MTRKQIICLACFSCAIAVLSVIGGFLAQSWEAAINGELSELRSVNQQALARTELVYQDAIKALDSIEARNLAPCSERHIATMRRITTNSRFISSMGFFRDGRLLCTAWGSRTNALILRRPYSFITKQEIEVTVGLDIGAPDNASKIAFYRDNYYVLINPDILLATMADLRDQFAVASHGFVLAQRNGVDPHLLGTLIKAPQSGMNKTMLFSSVQEGEFVAVVMRPKAILLKAFRQQMLFFLPIAGLISLLIGGIIIWVMRSRLSPLSDLRAAVHRREFIVHYQPIIELTTGRCVGAEALVRWRRCDGSIVLPAQFIDLAESSGLILPITDQVIDRCISELGDLLVADRNLHISINLCSQDIQTSRGLDYIQKQIGKAGIHSDQVWFEMTERRFVEIDAARETLIRMREFGHLVAIDDFGTGYSSLQHLQSLPLNALKIDKSFIDMIGRDTAGSTVTPYIIDMAAALKLFCIAEGVETKEQFDYLVRRNVAFGQGWFFSRPLTLGGFRAFYQKRKIRYGAFSKALILGQAQLAKP